MQVFALLFLAASASAASILTVPGIESSVVKTDQIGGNFAYSVAQNRAVLQPVISTLDKQTVLNPFSYSQVVQPAQVKSLLPETKFVSGVQLKSGLSYVTPLVQDQIFQGQLGSQVVKPIEIKSLLPETKVKDVKFDYSGLQLKSGLSYVTPVVQTSVLQDQISPVGLKSVYAQPANIDFGNLKTLNYGIYGLNYGTPYTSNANYAYTYPYSSYPYSYNVINA